MDPRENPYTPNAGARPPALVGRRDELVAFDILLDRLRDGYAEQSLIVTGLRGVGKTVLLQEFRDRALERSWIVVDIEVAKHDDDQFRAVLARELRRALFTLAPKASWSDRARRAAAVLRSFTLGIDPDGRLTAGFEVEPAEGHGDSGALDADLSDVLTAIGEAAKEHGTGVVLLFDEIQFLTRPQLEAVIVGLHRTVQRRLPITLTAAGLPQLAELAGEAKSYSERLFRFPVIDKLVPADAHLALVGPAGTRGVGFAPEALAVAIEFTEGYPYFLQEFGQAAWNVADGPIVSGADAQVARRVVEEKLDSAFFRVRHARTTELELAYLRAMAELGPQPHLAGAVARLLDRSSQQCGPTRSQLIDKGLLYTPEHGYAAFTVPQFDRYLKRVIPELVVPAKRERRRGSER